MPERPAGLPEGAVWSPSDHEWVLAPTDGDGEYHGVVTFWRPDGTLVNRCEFEHGTAHGWYERYHESGEVSREGRYERGVIHGTDRFYRSDEPTTESFPDGLGRRVWRAERDLRHGSVVAARCYDRDGRQVSTDGEPVPVRPDGVPESASYTAATGRWVDGATDTDARRHGLWRFYDGEGALVEEIGYDQGEQSWGRQYDSATEAEAEVALREGRVDEAVAAARALWTAAGRSGSRDSRRVVAGALLVRALHRRDAGDPEVSAVARELEPVLSAAASTRLSWGVFLPSGRKAYLAAGRVLTAWAEQLRARDPDRALGLVDQAIRLDHHYGTRAPRLLRFDLLRQLGRDDEAFQVARDLLAGDPDTPGLEGLADDPAFAAWLESIRTDSMTAAGAWDVLGERGDRLDEVTAPIAVTPGVPTGGEPVEARPLDTSWPVIDVLGDRLSPELHRFVSTALPSRIRDTYRGEFRHAVDSSVAMAVGCQDGTWVARLQSVFLPASTVLVEDEELWLASWHATSHGTSRVHYQHQDEPEWGRAGASLASFLADRILRDVAFEELALPAVNRERWGRAVELTDRDDTEELAGHLDVDAMEPRTWWIVRLLLGLDLGGDLDDAPGMAAWGHEREHVADWPHLQAYWLVHHLVFDNREALAELVEWADGRYPAIPELLAAARQRLAGQGTADASWESAAVRGLRARALDEERAYLFEPAALERVGKALAPQRAAESRLAAAKATLATHGSDAGAGADVAAGRVHRALEIWETLEAAAGSIAAFEEAALDQLVDDEDERLDHYMAQRAGHSSVLPLLFDELAPALDDRWLPLFEAAVDRGATLGEEHAAAVPGALFGLGMALGDFEAFLRRVEAAPFHPEEFGRRRRLEVACVAHHQWDQGEAPREFLRREAERFARQFSDWQVDAFAKPLGYLLDRRDPRGVAILDEALQAATFSGANARLAVELVARCRELGLTGARDGVWAAVRSYLGRHDDGDRAEVVRAYVACEPDRELAHQRLTTLLARAREEVATRERVDAREQVAAVLAGLLDLGAEAHGEQARTALEDLLGPGLGSNAYGAAASLLRSVRDSALPGFGDLAARLHERGEAQGVGGRMRPWLGEHLDGWP